MRSLRFLVLLAVAAAAHAAPAAMQLVADRYTVTVASGETSGYASINVQGIILAASCVAPDVSGESQTYTFAVCLPDTTTAVWQVANNDEDGVTHFNPENASGAYKWTNGVPVFSRPELGTQWCILVTTESAVAEDADYVVDLILLENGG